MKKLEFKIGLLLAGAGVFIVGFGLVQNYLLIRYSGYVVFLMGGIIMGNRLYERIKEKQKEKASLN